MTNATNTRNSTRANSETPAETPEGTEAVEKKEKDYETVAVQVPADFKAALNERAKNEKMTVAKFIRREMARLLEFDVSAFETRTRTRASKFTTDEEREAARKASADKRQNTIKALMAKYKSGEIKLTPEEIEAVAASAE